MVHQLEAVVGWIPALRASAVTDRAPVTGR
jgi:hypothetical protein